MTGSSARFKRKYSAMGGDMLFVYGSLRRGAQNPYARKLRRKGVWLGTVTASGRLFQLGRYPVLTPPRRRCEVVTGDLFWVGDPNLWHELDTYEECGQGVYQRVQIWIDDGTLRRRAWAYVVDGRNSPGARFIAGGDYFHRRVSG